MNERNVKLAARLYGLRDTAHNLWPDSDEYARRVKPLMDLLTGWAEAHPDASLIAGFNEIAKRAMDRGHDGVVIVLGAALCDLLEPA